MFTLTDIRDIAIQIERNGEATYRQAGKKTGNGDLARMLIWMADEEQRHSEWFAALASDRTTSPAHQEVEQMGRALLREMVKQQTFSLDGDRLDAAEDIFALLSQALNFEQDTIVFYEMLGSFIDDPQTRGQLDRIIEEERQHVAQIKRMQQNHAKLKPQS